MPYTDNVQADSDGDGAGDGCDAEPLSEDLDGDMIRNAEDNCPFDANQSQEDSDADEKGDLCDFCLISPILRATVRKQRWWSVSKTFSLGGSLKSHQWPSTV